MTGKFELGLSLLISFSLSNYGDRFLFIHKILIGIGPGILNTIISRIEVRIVLGAPDVQVARVLDV